MRKARCEKFLLRRFWLLFAQAATVCLAALFVVATLRPDLLARVSGRNNVVLLQETATPVSLRRVDSFADAAKKAMPAVVNIYTSKEVRTAASACSTTRSCAASSRACRTTNRAARRASARA